MVESTSIQNLTAAGSVTISASNKISTAINTGGLKLATMVIPVGMESGKISFQGSFDGGATFIDLIDVNGLPYVAKIIAGRAVMMVPLDFAGVDIIRLVSDEIETAERIIGIVMRP